MSRTRIIASCCSSKQASPTTSCTDIPYPRVSQRRASSTRSGVRRSPWRSGSSPIASRMVRTSRRKSASDIVHVVAGGFPEPDPRQAAPGNVGRELFPAEAGDVLGGGKLLPEPGHVEIQVAVIEHRKDALIGELLQNTDVNHVAGVGIDVSLHQDVELVVVAMIIRQVAFAEGLPVPGIGLARIVEAVRSVEMDPAGHDAGRHSVVLPREKTRAPTRLTLVGAQVSAGGREGT